MARKHKITVINEVGLPLLLINYCSDCYGLEENRLRIRQEMLYVHDSQESQKSYIYEGLFWMTPIKYQVPHPCCCLSCVLSRDLRVAQLNKLNPRYFVFLFVLLKSPNCRPISEKNVSLSFDRQKNYTHQYLNPQYPYVWNILLSYYKKGVAFFFNFSIHNRNLYLFFPYKKLHYYITKIHITVIQI